MHQAETSKLRATAIAVLIIGATHFKVPDRGSKTGPTSEYRTCLRKNHHADGKNPCWHPWSKYALGEGHANRRSFTDHARIVGYTEVGRARTGKSANVSATRADRAYLRVGRFATE
jgi:hypothetical protein